MDWWVQASKLETSHLIVGTPVPWGTWLREELAEGASGGTGQLRGAAVRFGRGWRRGRTAGLCHSGDRVPVTRAG